MVVVTALYEEVEDGEEESPEVDKFTIENTSGDKFDPQDL